jgi:hypothetical protein
MASTILMWSDDPREGTVVCVNGTEHGATFLDAGSRIERLNTNATATLVATYLATVQCRNGSSKIVEVHSQTVSVTSTSRIIFPENGRLSVNPITATAPSEEQFEVLATCPNPNWTAEILPGSITLVSFTYTVTFESFTEPAITIAGNDP